MSKALNNKEQSDKDEDDEVNIKNFQCLLNLLSSIIKNNNFSEHCPRFMWILFRVFIQKRGSKTFMPSNF